MGKKGPEKLGVFLCGCGPNISGILDLDNLGRFCLKFPEVSWVGKHGLLCSEEGHQEIIKQVKDNGLDRIVIAACSPKEHEHNFRKVCIQAGLNPFLMHVANIREQCAWVVSDKQQAGEKAETILRAAIRRVRIQEPIELKEISLETDTLVVGAGSAGIEASLLLAQKGRKVYLVERDPCVGGHITRYEEVFPNLECATCLMEGKIDELLHKDNIKVMTCSTVEEVLGYFGQFRVKVRRKARSVDPEKCIGCGVCYESCPQEVPNEFNEGMGTRKAIYIPYAGSLPNVPVIDRNSCLRFHGQECSACKDACPFDAVDFSQEDRIEEISAGAVVVATGFSVLNPAEIYGDGAALPGVYTSMKFERLCSSTGPTSGKIVLDNGQVPGSVVIIHCVGSRDVNHHRYCSGVCCMTALKFSHILKNKAPDAKITHLYSDWCLGGKGYQEFKQTLLPGLNPAFIRIEDMTEVKLNRGPGSKIAVTFPGSEGSRGSLTADMVILLTAMESQSDAEKVADLFSISRDEEGFFKEEHQKVDPVSTTTKGIYIAGCAQGPKDIPESVAQGGAAAGRILSILMPGEMHEVEPQTAKINEELCGGCKTCISVCPYKAIIFDAEKKISVVEEVLCQGCGTCASACPSGAAEHNNFTMKQLSAEIEEMVYGKI